MKTWSQLEHTIWDQLKLNALDHKNQFIVCVSGGADSVVMMQTLLKIKPLAEIIIVHYHHGTAEKNKAQSEFRDQALELVKNYSEILQSKHNIQFYFEKSETYLISEDECRKARKVFFQKIQAKYPQAVLVTGHHRDDVLETRLIKLIRGTGAESFTTFKFWNGETLRLLLETGKADILKIAQHNNYNFIDDPSNLDSAGLRNWIRNKWLKDLEQFQLGGSKNLSLSFDKIVGGLDHQSDPLPAFDVRKNELQQCKELVFQRLDFEILSFAEKQRCLAKALRTFKDLVFSQGQIKEIIKRLDKNQKNITFSLIGINWFIDAQQVMLQLNDRHQKQDDQDDHLKASSKDVK